MHFLIKKIGHMIHFEVLWVIGRSSGNDSLMPSLKSAVCYPTSVHKGTE